jgi:hypothetical protein
MAVNATQHRTDVEELDETGEGGLINYRWSCLCRRTGRWTQEAVAAEKAGKAHERRSAPKARGYETLRGLISLN